jgi:hypothetical protein
LVKKNSEKIFLRNGFHELFGRELGDAVVADVTRRSLFNENVDLGELLSGLFAARVQKASSQRHCRGISITPAPGGGLIEESKEILLFLFDVRS